MFLFHYLHCAQGIRPIEPTFFFLLIHGHESWATNQWFWIHLTRALNTTSYLHKPHPCRQFSVNLIYYRPPQRNATRPWPTLEPHTSTQPKPRQTQLFFAQLFDRHLPSAIASFPFSSLSAPRVAFQRPSLSLLTSSVPLSACFFPFPLRPRASSVARLCHTQPHFFNS